MEKEKDFVEQEPSVIVKILKILAALFLLVAILGAIAFFSFEWAFSALVHTRKEVPTPDITHKQIDVALDLLAQSKLALQKMGEEFQVDLPAGTIIRQLPPAGTSVREGKVVRVWISQGKENIEVPDVSNLPLRSAEFALRQANLVIGTKETKSSLEIEKGNIISQEPQAGAIVVKGSTINLIVSSGVPSSASRIVPDFRHKKLVDVSNWASSRNVEVRVIEDPESSFPNGIITAQSVAPDNEVKKDEALSITVSTRPASEGESFYRLHYELPQGKNENRVRIVLYDRLGERELMNEMKLPGSKIDFMIPYSEKSTFRVYVDGILVRQKEIL